MKMEMVQVQIDFDLDLKMKSHLDLKSQIESMKKEEVDSISVIYLNMMKKKGWL